MRLPRSENCLLQGFARAPIVEMLVPLVVDPTLIKASFAPKGAHVAPLFCRQFKPEADWGANFSALKDRAAQAIYDALPGRA
jgi:hypothetical protein